MIFLGFLHSLGKTARVTGVGVVTGVTVVVHPHNRVMKIRAKVRFLFPHL